MSKYKYLITSGCSFSERMAKNWPKFLSEDAELSLINVAAPSAGNTWISKSAIYSAHQLLKTEIDPSDILIIVMWSGIDRVDSFVSTDSLNFNDLITSLPSGPNPVNFLDTPLEGWISNTTDGYLLGSISANFNKYISEFKKSLIMDHLSEEALAIESYENFLKLQWFCQSNHIKLINLTYMDIMHYPSTPLITRPAAKLTKDYYRNVEPLHEMIDFTNWLFWKNTQGLYEYTKQNNLPFADDQQHPHLIAHRHYVDNYLLPKLKERNIL